MPSRVMMTTESFPREAFQEWRLARDMPYIVGEFVWTAMDYLGESGIGGWRFGTPERAKQVEGIIPLAGTWFANIGADGKNPFPPAEKSTDPSTDPNPMATLASVGRPYHEATCGDIDLSDSASRSRITATSSGIDAIAFTRPCACRRRTGRRCPDPLGCPSRAGQLDVARS